MPEKITAEELLKAQLSKFDHVVVLMLENRSFDNLLGNLYSPEEFKPPQFSREQKFSGLKFGGPYFNVIPTNVTDGHGGKKLYTFRSTDYFQPYPDPGETYPQVNTQLYNQFNPSSNENIADGGKFSPPFNVPEDGANFPAPMTGFIKDYLSVLRSLQLKGCMGMIWKFIYKLFRVNPKWFKLNDTFKDYKTIMECFENDQVPVLTTLAKEFAVFDNWHCDVPSQTYPNRAFWHSATSFGFVNNSPMKKWILNSNSPTIFNKMNKEISWNIYTDNIISLTAIIHFQQLKDYFLSNFHSFKRFQEDAKNGKLPQYSFVEPRFFTPHNDQHPSNYDSLDPVGNPGAVGSVLLGEKLILDVYNAIKCSTGDSQGKGNTWKNTLLIITHDEHGGCFDHIPPTAAPKPFNKEKSGEMNFNFDRLGVRVPMVMVSAYIKPNTIVRTKLRHTSFLNTISKKWGLPHLTDRDAKAQPFTEVFNTDQPRNADSWPDIAPPIIPDEFYQHDFSDTLLGDLEKNIIKSVSQWKTGSLAAAEKIHTARQAMQFLHDLNKKEKLPGADLEELTHQWKLD